MTLISCADRGDRGIGHCGLRWYRVHDCALRPDVHDEEQAHRGAEAGHVLRLPGWLRDLLLRLLVLPLHAVPDPASDAEHEGEGRLHDARDRRHLPLGTRRYELDRGEEGVSGLAN